MTPPAGRKQKFPANQKCNYFLTENLPWGDLNDKVVTEVVSVRH